MKNHLMKAFRAAIGILIGFSTAAYAQVRPPTFGKQWVQSHPYTLMALSLRDSLVDLPEYTGANLNTMLAWETQPNTLIASAAAGLPWIKRYPALNGAEPSFVNVINSILQNSHNAGFLINDEPLTQAELAATGNALDWLKANHPDKLAFSNLAGGLPDLPGRTDVFLAQIRPDILMFDNYPYPLSGSESGSAVKDYYSNLGTIRSKALQANLPYWVFIQAYGNSNVTQWSDSDMRAQVYAALAHGYTGLAYYTYDPPDNVTRSLLDINGAPTTTYQRVKQINGEVLHLGGTIKSLKSDSIGYVGFPGPPSGLTAWNSSNSPYITGITATNLGSLNFGLPGNLLVGMFTTDDAMESLDGPAYENEIYFMITNLLRSHGADAAAARQSVRVNFNFAGSGIDSLQRLNRTTGQVEVIPLISDGGSQYHLIFNLDGGTGDLFKFNTGAPFIVPKPAMIGWMVPLILPTRRRIAGKKEIA
ncbi:MAG: hypothetical protein IT446_16120 [Phycisphaerales bacterium]|nr:hypothetical protein [Phycisphaerales bacterium]